MFKIASSDTYRWPVKVSIPTGDGKHETHRFTMIFKRVPMTRMEELLKQEDRRDRVYAKEFVAGWGDDVLDNDGEPVPFTDDNLDAFLEIPAVATAIVLAYFESVEGAKRKN